MDGLAIEQYKADSPPTIVRLEIKPHFDALTEQQKRYAHYISRAAFSGTRIVLRQVSPESEPIYDFIIGLHHACNGNWKEAQRQSGISDDELRWFLEYAAQFLGNCGNYKSFGDSKIIPRARPEVFEALAATSAEAKHLFEKTKVGGGLYASKDAALMHFGYPGHMSTYYPDSPNITKEEIMLVGEFLDKKRLLPENTRLYKTEKGNFEVLIASAVKSPPSEASDLGEVTHWELDGPLKGKTVSLVFGDHIEEMAKIALNIKKAGQEAANEIQRKMHEEYAKSFGTGSMEAYKQSQRYWIQDKGPTVESDIGFIETYRDPHGVRGEWEGFVAMVNQERTRAFGKLVESAESMIPKLPWSKDFEKDHFLSPDFTSLEVLTFSGSGIPAGINIPNFDDIRQNVGFKNVSLGNVLGAKAPNEPIPFIRPEDLDIYQKNRDAAFEVQVGIHELLGHGTGKLLQETSPGQYNFDINNPPLNPVTNKPVATWYKPGQTWGSVFGSTASSYEECRAECVAMALSCDFSILAIFGFGTGQADLHGPAGDVLYTAYLQMARAGVVALELWDPKSRKWGQIHMQARFAILQTFLAAGDGFVTLDHSREDLSDLTIKLDRSKILTHGRPAVERFLQKLHVYKSTADLDAGKKLYEEMTHVDDEWWGGRVRVEVLRRKTPRKIFVQANTVLEAERVMLREYEPTLEGMIRSFAERDV